MSKVACAPMHDEPIRIEPHMKREWGTERKTAGPDGVHIQPGRPALAGARFALFLTVAAWLAYFAEQAIRFFGEPLSFGNTLETGLYLLVVTTLAASSSAYLLCRMGYLSRSLAYRRAPRVLLDSFYEHTAPSLSVIVPSFQEEPRVVRQTLLSSALQEYPNLRITLLIDDPPPTSDDDEAGRLGQSRALPQEIERLLETPRRRSECAYRHVDELLSKRGTVQATVLRQVATAYEEASLWLRETAGHETVEDHIDAFLVNDVILRLAGDFDQVAGALVEAADAGAVISPTRVRQLCRRLVWIFQAELSSFERKQFASLSHEPSKAANLNSYLGLMGGRYRTADTPAGTVLLPVRGEDYSLEIPDPDYVLTLDADSMLLPEYCLRLVAYMEQPEHAGVAVAQTPYSSYRGAPTRLERIAGATTDIQHMIHQGLTKYGATFWVGANAVIRKKALDSIMVEESHKGFTIKRYIRDRTVVEDTESSLDLRLAGWRLENIPERLSYSATPADFGSLCVQRERWANGGLLILPKLARLVILNRSHWRSHAVESFLRLNYLASITWTSLGLLILLFWPFDQQLLSSLAVLTALPYFVAVASDLRRAGYRRRDVVRIYGFNMILLPINVVGTLKSIGQAIGGQKVAFARTPKVRSRTVAPIVFVVAPLLVIDWSAMTLLYDLVSRHYLHAGFAGLNLVCTSYAWVALLGIRHSLVDIVVNLKDWVFPVQVQARQSTRAVDWVTVLYHGPAAAAGEPGDLPAMAGALAAMDGDDAENRDILLAGRHVGLSLVQPETAPNHAPEPATQIAANGHRPDRTGPTPPVADQDSWPFAGNGGL